jgi:hypothetical protein
MGMRRRVAVAAFGICTVLAYVALPTEAAGAANGTELPISDPVMETRTTTFAQRNIDAVFDGTRWFAAWAEFRGGGFDLFGGRITPEGDLPDGGGLTISTGVDGGDALNPSIAVDGNGQFLVAWTDNDQTATDVYAARISPSGRVLDPAAIDIAVGVDADASPSVAWNGSVFLVAWTHGGTGGSTMAALVTPAGAVSQLGVVSENMVSPSVAASGSTFLVVGSQGISSIIARRFDGAGVPLGSVFSITKDEVLGRQIQPSVAGGPNGWVAVWTDERNTSVGNGDIFGARIASDGSVTDPDGIPISAATGSQQTPVVGMRGSAALVAWRDGRDGEDDAMAAHLTGAGVVSETDGFAISATAGSESPAAVVLGPEGGYAAFYQRGAPEAPYGGSIHGFVRTVGAK